MALFNRRKTTTDIPELQEYYAAKRANNSAGAWVLALISLVVTVLVILGLFFGGRWLWRTLTGNDEDKNVTTTQEAADQVEEGIESDTGVDASDAAQEASDAAREAANNAEEAVTDNNGTATQPSSGQTGSTGASTTTPNTDEEIAAARASGSLPNSGPGDVVSLFVVSTSIGYFYYRRKQLNN
ncbi:MAG: hypothetical protein M3Q79_04480 [bacterium]|nr:hypothetical protein [bacterium]